MFGQVFVPTLLFVTAMSPLVAQAQPDFNLIPRDDAFPDGISPIHVYARIDLLERSLDALLEARTIRLKETDFPRAVEKDLKPMHVYQAVLVCAWRLQQLDDHPEVDIKPIPTISADPRVYYPRDVFFIVDMMRQALGMETIPVPEMSVREDIRPFDVFFQTQIIIAELNLLKKALQTKSSSPLPVPVTGKTPTRVHEQATMILHLLKQVKLPEPESRVE